MDSFKQRIDFHKRTILTISLLLAFLWSLFSVQWDNDILHSGGRTTILQIIKALLNPDLSSDILVLALISSWRTLAYAITGMSLALAIGFIFGILASGVLRSKGLLGTVLPILVKRLLGFMRSIHELVWAWLLVSAIGLSPLAAIIAIGIPYGGTLGRIFADILKDVPSEPIKSLESNGASNLQQLFYGYLPMSMADMLSYTMYRFECAIRSSAIMSFVGLGGLGYQIHLSLADLEYDEAWTFIFFLIGFVLLTDLWSNMLRRRLI